MDKETLYMVGIVLLFILIAVIVSVALYGVIAALVVWVVEALMREAHNLWH